jgi:polyferredoxin
MKFRTETRRALLSTLFVFGLLTWLYVILVQMAHPDWLSEPLSHINAFPFNLRVDLTGMGAFAVSALAFFFLQLTPKREEKR